MTTMERAEAAERALSEELERAVVKSVIYTSGDRDPRQPAPPRTPGKKVMMGHDPRLPQMPEKPTLFDFFRYRFAPANHLLQSARLAQKSGASEKLVLACLVHDIAIAGFIRGDLATGPRSSSRRTWTKRSRGRSLSPGAALLPG